MYNCWVIRAHTGDFKHGRSIPVKLYESFSGQHSFYLQMQRLLLQHIVTQR